MIETPSVLRAIQSVVEAGDRADREVCVCGEAVGDLVIAGLFAGLGIRQLSMSPICAAKVGRHLREQSHQELKSIATQVVQSESIRDTKQMLDKVAGWDLSEVG